MKNIIKNEFNTHITIAQLTFESVSESLEQAAKLCIECLSNGNKILIFGNKVIGSIPI